MLMISYITDNHIRVYMNTTIYKRNNLIDILFIQDKIYVLTQNRIWRLQTSKCEIFNKELVIYYLMHVTFFIHMNWIN